MKNRPWSTIILVMAIVAGGCADDDKLNFTYWSPDDPSTVEVVTDADESGIPIEGERTGGIDGMLEAFPVTTYIVPEETGGLGVGFLDVTAGEIGSAGVPPGFQGVTYLVPVGPIPEDFRDQEICFDSSLVITESTRLPWEWTLENDGDDETDDVFPPTYGEVMRFNVVLPGE